MSSVRTASGEEDKSQVVEMATIISGMTPGEGGRLLLAPYLDAYREMNKFFQLLGPFFQFVGRDLTVKVELLQTLLKESRGHHYTSIQSMIAYEKDNNLLTTNLGCRTLLRLHRALDFVRSFVMELAADPQEESFSTTISRLYHDTVGRFHTYVLAKTFSGILLLLPKRHVLIDRLTRGNMALEAEYRREIPKTVEAMGLMYDATQQLYHHHNLLHLP